LLQQGDPVADIAVFYGEDRNLTERYQDRFNTDVPAGYGFDYLNPEALLTRVSVRDGCLVTRGGARYSLLYIPPYVTRVTLPVLRTLRDLVHAGLVLVGRKPTGGLGLQSPDAEVKALAAEIWSDPRVHDTTDLRAVLEAEHILADVRAEVPGRPLGSVHRRDGDVDIYFISNAHRPATDVPATFRVRGKRPEIWHAEDGRVESVSYEQTSEGVRVPLHLEENAAEFVVFRRRSDVRSWGAPTVTTSVLMQVGGPWSVTFQTGRGAPPEVEFDQLIDWSVSSDPGVKYFSGAAVYSRQLTVSPTWIRQDRRVILDLGDVRELAVVSIDGQTVATAWHSPYEVDLTAALTPGNHRLDIKVVNLWVNRLIGDKQPGAAPLGFAPQSPYTANSPLRASGLLGPVRILARDSAQPVQ
jgi:hypothetical protein